LVSWVITQTDLLRAPNQGGYFLTFGSPSHEYCHATDTFW